MCCCSPVPRVPGRSARVPGRSYDLCGLNAPPPSRSWPSLTPWTPWGPPVRRNGRTFSVQLVTGESPPTAHWQASHWGSQLAAERCCWLAAWPELLQLQNMCWRLQALASSGGSSRCSTHGAPRGVAQATPRTYRVRVRVSSATASPSVLAATKKSAPIS